MQSVNNLYCIVKKLSILWIYTTKQVDFTKKYTVLRVFKDINNMIASNATLCKSESYNFLSNHCIDMSIFAHVMYLLY